MPHHKSSYWTIGFLTIVALSIRAFGVDIAYTESHLFTSDALAGDSFGISVAIKGNTAIVGASHDDGPAGTDQGSAYASVRSGSTWSQQAHLFASDAALQDSFGSSVAIGGDTAIVGAAAGNSTNVFVRSGTTWMQQQKLMGSDAAPGDRFGHSVALSGDTALVGAYAQGDRHMFLRVTARYGANSKN